MTGDFYFLADDIGTYTPKFMMFDKSTEELGEVSASTQYNIGINSPGLFRHFLDISNQEKNNSNVRFDIMNIDDGARMQFIHSGFTLPINAALWAGANGSTLHSYQWQSDANGNWNGNDATAAVQAVTTSACTKLKSDWGSNIRIYLIKYRKQTQYKHPVTGEAVNFNYDYLDYCASSRDADSIYDTTATSSEEAQKNKYIYDITADDLSEAKGNLDKALKAIANDIKKWAEYEEAKNVN
jgi:hypothetical protein